MPDVEDIAVRIGIMVGGRSRSLYHVAIINNTSKRYLYANSRLYCLSNIELDQQEYSEMDRWYGGDTMTDFHYLRAGIWLGVPRILQLAAVQLLEAYFSDSLATVLGGVES